MKIDNYKIYVVVVTYNGFKWIDKCFGSLCNSTIQLNILAIDNASTDGTPKFIKDRYSNVNIIETGQNLGFGIANNIGFKEAIKNDADYVFLLNQDAWIEPDTIEKLIEVHAENPSYGLISSLHLNPNNEDLEYYFKGYLNEAITPNLANDAILKKEMKAIYQTQFVNAAAWLISKKCLTDVGGFDPIFFMYGEDDDYLMRVKYKNYKIGIVPHTRIYHDSNPPNPNKININRAISYNIKQLKDLNHSFRSLLVSLIKANIDDITTLLLKRQFGKAHYTFNVLLKTLSKINKLKKSRNLSLSSETPFL